MYRSFSLSSGHFAANWVVSDEDTRNDRHVVNQLALKWATMKEGPRKRALFLELVECFHSYLMKYLNMITRGQLPSLRTKAGRDAELFLKTLIDPGQSLSQATLVCTCRSLHLAFKQQTTDDVYDTLVMIFLQACRQYDPHYTKRVQKVCESIDGPFASILQFTAADVSERVGFNALRCLRLLAKPKNGFLVTVKAKKKVVGYSRGPAWPPPLSFFQSGPVGFTYFVQQWFRWILNDYVEKQRDTLEAQDGVLQLEHGASRSGDHLPYRADYGTPHAQGNITDSHGYSWSADTTLMNMQLDVSLMSDAWIKGTDDWLFHSLEDRERWILQMVYRKELNWVEIGATLGVSPQTARQTHDQIMLYLKGKASLKTKKARA